ncbi:hypothetical protein RW080711_184 [Synechococcus phage S-RIM8]|uniref:Uncharacterized protein n=2 Tax=Neptunevirus srim18 TaxID=2734121 RepID=A0A1D7SBI8_9CAUD|nr:cytidyltransferase [Synechococcus phage S-RIM8 A.HR1]YP_009783093.1 cytidyltransferase [Synechococcus phage S-RIM8]AFB15444.1 hypothetical protein SWSG_00120 [Synechococcus phage S-RIM8 A.HR5]AGH57867.1 hypothetical protein CPJG_00115 [Synechococcus phage KBS-M-1A]AFB17669.1 hypothetical protein SXDG_00169 [Synechococcus phage S-RIM8 A.HR1]AOO10993.1 hypothetical protein RW080711_184 [Synechococcus phage S-RIM8]AOO11216.1 hypothetical protein RW220300_185 [Synechococcus phage S-RIM8]
MNLNDLPDMSDALKQVQMYEAKKKGDGNLANNAVPYDKVTKADIVTGALGQDEEGGKKKPKGHDCAKLVKYAPDGSVKEEFETIPEMHTMLEDGTVTHYDITDGEWIYENVPVEELEIVISEKHEHFVNYDKNAEVLGEDAKYDRNRKRAAQRAAARNAARDAGQTGVVPGVGYVSPRRERETYVDSAGVTRHKSGAKNEAFAFSDAEWQELAMLGEEIDAMTDEQLIDFMEEIILEVAEDDQDLLEICEALEEVELISERVDPKETQRRRDQAKDRLATGSAMKSAAEKSSAPSGPSRLERMKTAAKGAATRVGSAVKAGAKMAGRAATKAGKAAVSTAGKVAGTYQGEKEAARIKAKRASMEKTPPKKKETSSDDDGTGGKLDALLKSTRGTSSSSDSGSKSGGGGESSHSGPTILARKKSSDSGDSEKGSTRKAVGSALKSAARLVGRGIKKAVGKTARAVSSGSDRLAKRLGEDYEQIAHLYESGLFSIEEIENVIEEGYKEIDRDKENRMYRRAGNLARTSLSSTGKAKRVAQDKSAKIVSAITSKKERERFDRIGQDPKHQNNYGG